MSVRNARDVSNSGTQHFANTILQLFQRLRADGPSASGVAGRTMGTEKSGFQEKAQRSVYRTQRSDLQHTHNKGSIQIQLTHFVALHTTKNCLNITVKPTNKHGVYTDHYIYIYSIIFLKRENFLSLCFNPLNPELIPICYLLALLGAHHFLYVSRIRVKLLTFRRLMSYIYIWSTHS